MVSDNTTKQERFSGAGVRLALLAALLCLAGCPENTKTETVTKFSTACATAKGQLDTTFTSIDEFAAEDELSRGVSRTALNEDSFVTVIKPDDVAKWDNAFEKMDGYTQRLQALLSPEVPKNFEDSLVGFGTQLQKVRPEAVPDAGVATAFAELGRLLIAAKAERDAQTIAMHADPGIRQILTTMADVIGNGSSNGLRGTVHTHWTVRMGEKQVAFLAPDNTPALKQKLVLDYFAIRDKRDAQDLQLTSLRQSLLELADAHSAMARGATTDLAASVTMLKREFTETQSLYDQFKLLKQPKGDSK
jgi:hypothetical protein